MKFLLCKCLFLWTFLLKRSFISYSFERSLISCSFKRAPLSLRDFIMNCIKACGWWWDKNWLFVWSINANIRLHSSRSFLYLSFHMRFVVFLEICTQRKRQVKRMKWSFGGYVVIVASLCLLLFFPSFVSLHNYIPSLMSSARIVSYQCYLYSFLLSDFRCWYCCWAVHLLVIYLLYEYINGIFDTWA